MGRVNVLADALKTISHAERIGKRDVLVRPSSGTIIRFLKVMQKNGLLNVKMTALQYLKGPRKAELYLPLRGQALFMVTYMKF